MPLATSLRRRAARMFLARPMLLWNSPNRRLRRKASRTIRSDHHSPMVSSERATGQVAASRLLRFIAGSRASDYPPKIAVAFLNRKSNGCINKPLHGPEDDDAARARVVDRHAGRRG